MKKLSTLLFTAVCAGIALTGCGTSNTAGQTAETNEPAESEVPAEVTESPSDTSVKTLIVYFSPANADTADLVSGATPRVGDVSSVEYIAQSIHGQVEADIAKIIPSDPYPEMYEDTADRAKAEQDNNERPEFVLDVNPEDYDVIFVGYPVWWYRLPMIMNTFFETYDFSGKTVIPFNTHAGSRDGGTYDEIREIEPDADVRDGLAVSGERAGSAEKEVSEWIQGLGY